MALFLAESVAATYVSPLAKNAASSSRSAKSVSAEFLLPFSSTRRYQDCCSNSSTGAKRRGIPPVRSSSFFLEEFRSAAAFLAKDEAIRKALKADERATGNESGRSASGGRDVEERVKGGDEMVNKDGEVTGQSSLFGMNGRALEELTGDHIFAEEFRQGPVEVNGTNRGARSANSLKLPNTGSKGNDSKRDSGRGLRMSGRMPIESNGPPMAILKPHFESNNSDDQPKEKLRHLPAPMPHKVRPLGLPRPSLRRRLGVVRRPKTSIATSQVDSDGVQRPPSGDLETV